MFRSISLKGLLSLGCILALAVGAGAQTPTFASQVDGLEGVALEELPVGAAQPQERESEACVVPQAEVSTPAGQAVAAKNWLVTAEIELGGFTFVSFVERAERGTSGSCWLSDGNVGVFLGDDLLGVIYADDQMEYGIGKIQKLEGDRLRIRGGNFYGTPRADLQVVDGDLFLIKSVAERDSFCDGKVMVPNIYGLRIHDARRILFQEDWRPNPALAAREYGSSFGPSFDELDSCSGTGFGLCSFEYVWRDSGRLYVTTGGELYSVVALEVSCD